MTVATPQPFAVDDLSDFSRPARWILVVAAAEARMARHPAVGSGHIVLATWLASTCAAGRALREAGISGGAAKAWLNHEVRPQARSDEPGFDWRLIEEARRVARSHGSEVVSPEHLLRAATLDAESDGVRMIRAQGVTPERLHHLIESVLSIPPAPAIVERFTDLTEAVIVSAGAHARQCWHEEVGTAHVLLGLVDTPSEVQEILAEQRVTFEAARVAFMEVVGTGTGGPTDHVPFSLEMERVLEGAAARAGGSIAPHHLLAALIDHGTGDDQDILRALGADPAVIRTEIADQPAGAADTEAGEESRPVLNLERLRIRRRRPRPNRGWRPEILLVALAFLSIVGGEAPNVWTRIGYGACAAGALAIGSGAFLRAWIRKGPWRPIRLLSAIALMIGATALLLGRAFA